LTTADLDSNAEVSEPTGETVIDAILRHFAAMEEEKSLLSFLGHLGCGERSWLLAL
jgi:hypothetical protein